MITKKDIKVAKPKTRKIATPEWRDNGHVFIRKLSGVQVGVVQELIARHSHDAKDASAKDNGSMTDTRLLAELCIVLVCDADAEPLLEAKDVTALLEGPYAPIERCVMAGLDFNHLTEDSADSARENLKKTPGGAHG